MRPLEVMRVQGLSTRRHIAESDNKVRSMVGNSMSVGTVAALAAAVLSCLTGFFPESVVSALPAPEPTHAVGVGKEWKMM